MFVLFTYQLTNKPNRRRTMYPEILEDLAIAYYEKNGCWPEGDPRNGNDEYSDDFDYNESPGWDREDQFREW